MPGIYIFGTLLFGSCCAEEPLSEAEEAISTGVEAVAEYTTQLLGIMQDQAEARGGVATLGILPAQAAFES